MALFFSFEELFGYTPDEELIKLTRTEIDLIKEKVDKKKAFQDSPKETTSQAASKKEN